MGVLVGLLLVAALMGLIYWLYRKNSRYENDGGQVERGKRTIIILILIIIIIIIIVIIHRCFAAVIPTY